MDDYLFFLGGFIFAGLFIFAVLKICVFRKKFHGDTSEDDEYVM